MKHWQSMRLGVFLLGLFVSASGYANVTGADAQNFNPTTSGLDFVTVQSPTTLDPGIFNLGLFANYAVNTLPYFNNATTGQSRGHVNDTLLMSDFNLGFGVWDGWELGFSYPRLIKQTVNSTGARGEFDQMGNTELRFMSKWRLFENNSQGAALIVSSNINRVKNNPYAGRDAGPTINVELAYGWHWFDWAFGGNVGYRSKKPGDPIPGTRITPNDDEMIASLAASRYLSAVDSKLIVEIFGSRPAKPGDPNISDRQKSTLELLGGIKHFLTNELALHMGAGTEMIHGASSPDWRAYVGINWTTDTELRRPSIEVSQGGGQPNRSPQLPPVQKGELGINFGKIYFKSGSWTHVLPGAEDTLKRLVEYVKQPPEFKKLVIEGHTDSIGAEKANLELSQKRADTVKRMLVEKFGLEAAKIEAVGYGESRPLYDNGNFQGRQKNRRVYFRVTR